MAPTAQALAEQCEIVLAMVSDPEAALQLATGPDGIAAGMGAGKGYVDASTIDAGTAQKIAEVSSQSHVGSPTESLSCRVPQKFLCAV